MLQLTTSINNLIRIARDTQNSIRELESRLAEMSIPKLTDNTQLPTIYTEVQQQMCEEHIQDIRMCFVFVAVYLYSPASIYGTYPLKAGLRPRLGSLIGRSNAEVSKMFTSAKLHYEKIPGFREKIDSIIGSLSVLC